MSCESASISDVDNRSRIRLCVSLSIQLAVVVVPCRLRACF